MVIAAVVARALGETSKGVKNVVYSYAKKTFLFP
jgi:hypothetical protein